MVTPSSGGVSCPAQVDQKQSIKTTMQRYWQYPPLVASIARVLGCRNRGRSRHGAASETGGQ